MVTIDIAQSENDFEGIKDLNVRNLYGVNSAREEQSQGFVTCPYSVDDIKIMNNPYPHIIANFNDTIVGYCLVMLKQHSDVMPVLQPMFELISRLDLYGQALSEMRYFTMGQVCVDKAHRGTGVFYRMYDYLKDQMQGNFDLVITEISALNTRSLRAHEKQGFIILKEYQAPDGHPWVVVCWDWRVNKH